MIEVGEPLRNLVLNAAFFVILLITLISIIPWQLGAARKRRHWTLFLPWLALFAYLVYEFTMPSRINIRVDLLLIAPALLICLVAAFIRWLLIRRQARMLNGQGH